MRMHLHVLIPLLLSSPSSSVYTGSPGCSCISSPSWPVNVQDLTGITDTDNTACTLIRNAKGESICMQSDYGVGECKAWDDQTTHSGDCTLTGSARPKWCDEPWCYVDLTSCLTNRTKFTVKSTDLIAGAERSAYFSYETCGGDSSAWEVGFVKDTLEGQELRVGVPLSFYPEAYMEAINTKSISEYHDEHMPVDWDTLDNGYELKGLYADVFKEFATEGGFTMKVTDTSFASQKDSASSWTACVADVAAGVLDVCLGGFWVTKERIDLNVAFATPILMDNFYVMYPTKNNKASLIDLMYAPLMPFSTGLWWGIVSMFFWIAFLYTVADFYTAWDEKNSMLELEIEDEKNEEEEQMMRKMSYHNSKTRFQRFESTLNKEAQVVPKHDADGGEKQKAPFEKRGSMAVVVDTLTHAKEHRGFKRKLAFTHRMVHRAYHSTMEMASGAVVYDGIDGTETTWGLKIIRVTYGLFIVVVLACYTGSMAAMRSSMIIKSPLTSVKDCANSASCSVCVSGVVEPYFKEIYPSLRTVKSGGSGVDVIKELLAGDCSIAVYGDDADFSQFAFGPIEKYDVQEVCTDFSVAPQVEHTVLLSFPVASQYVEAFSRLAVEMNEQGKVHQIRRKHKMLFEELCDEAQEDIDPEAEGFTMEDMAGLFIVAFGMSIIGMFINMHHYRSENIKLRKWEDKARASGAKVVLDGADITRNREASIKRGEKLLQKERMNKHKHGNGFLGLVGASRKKIVFGERGEGSVEKKTSFGGVAEMVVTDKRHSFGAEFGEDTEDL
ncbi:hypothetical protein TrLO_g8137 [Triparma laevis f. longispina]|uniref:Ionotropic glutamate receptor C-terminal domain-containing protein n=1 Tax=Triparma laevis f. longispina TaxID=1714387 RepID=A0A9W7C375_9STRA|nr:hypothetical protein TrLO_g8137 [Triparma laevis f. longispina]